MKMIFKKCLILIAFIGISSVSFAQYCACYECIDPFVCTVAGYSFNYPDQDTCIQNEPDCGGVPVDSNSWALLVVGATLITAGAFLAKRNFNN